MLKVWGGASGKVMRSWVGIHLRSMAAWPPLANRTSMQVTGYTRGPAQKLMFTSIFGRLGNLFHKWQLAMRMQLYAMPETSAAGAISNTH